MDTRRCVTYDPEADYYERDRNGVSGCGRSRPGSYPPSGSAGSGSYLPPGGSAGGGSYLRPGGSVGGGNYLPPAGSAGGYYDYNRGDNRRYDYYHGGNGGYYDGYSGGGSDNSGSGYYQNDNYYGSKPCKGCRDKDYAYDNRRPYPNTDAYDDRRPPSAGGGAYDGRYRPYSEDTRKYGGNYPSGNIIWDVLCFYRAK